MEGVEGEWRERALQGKLHDGERILRREALSLIKIKH